jgi:uncharacterized protein (TIGR02145 family)
MTNLNEVTIGTQVWMTKNLDVSTFRNGDLIPEVKTNEEWKAAGENKQPACCYYQNDPANGENYGKLYNWYAVNDPRGLAPEGWHVPSGDEWTKLTDFLGGESKAGSKMKSETGWRKEYSSGSQSTNSSSFNGLPGGSRSNDGPFYGIGSMGFWWSSPKRARSLSFKNGVVGRASALEVGFSVRCLRD